MEISSNSASLKSHQGTSSQFSFSTDTQEESAFDLLLAMPVAASQELDRETVDEAYAAEELEVSGCPACESEPESETENKPNADATEESSDSVDDSVQAITAASVATIDAIAAQQNSVVEQPSVDKSAQVEVVEQPKVDAADITGEVVATPVVDPSVDESAKASVLPAIEIEKESELSTQDSPIVSSDSPVSRVPATDIVKPNQPQARDSRQTQSEAQSKQQAPSSKVAEPVGQRASKNSDSSQEVDADSLKNTRGPATSQSAESSRRASNRERPERWYERDSNETQPNDLESQVQPAEAEIASVEPTLSANLTDSSDQSTEQFPGETKSNDLATTAVELDATASNTIDSTTVIAATSYSAIASESSSNSSNDTLRSLASSLERTLSKSTDSSAKLESSQTGQQVDITRAEKARLVQRVARSFTRIGATGGNLQLKLHPPELGALAVQVRIEGKNMTAKLTTESQAAKEVIMESLPQLRSRLAEQGFDVVQFTVDVSSDSSSLGNNSGAGQTGAGQGEQFGSSAEGESGQNSSFNLRRANYLRRQLDSANVSTKSFASSGLGRGVDIQA